MKNIVLPSKYPDLDELAFEPYWSVWCVNDRAWCPYTKPFLGRKHEATEEMKHWASGERAAVDPKKFTYEVRFNIRAALHAERTKVAEAERVADCVGEQLADVRDAFDEVQARLSARISTLRLAIRDIGALIAKFKNHPEYVMTHVQEIVDEHDTNAPKEPGVEV